MANTSTATTALFPSIPTACGNGLASGGAGGAVNPSPCATAERPEFELLPIHLLEREPSARLQQYFFGGCGLRRLQDQRSFQNINLNHRLPGRGHRQQLHLRAVEADLLQSVPLVLHHHLPESRRNRQLPIVAGRRNQARLPRTVRDGGLHARRKLFVARTSERSHSSRGHRRSVQRQSYPSHHLAITATYAIPGIKVPGKLLDGWQSTRPSIFSARYQSF